MSGIFCNSSLDCISDDRIFKECIVQSRISDELRFCDCSPLFGWTGDECNQPSTVTYIIRYSGVALLVWILFLITRVYKLYLIAYSLVKDGVQGSKRAMVMLLLDIMSVFLAFAGVGLFVYHFFDSSNYNVQETRNYIFLGKNFTIEAYWILYSPGLPVVLAAFVKVLNLFSLVKAVGHVLENKYLREERIIINLLYFLIPGSLISMPVLLIYELYEIAIAIGVLMSVLFIFFYSYALTLFLHPIERTLTRISRSTSFSIGTNKIQEAYDFIQFNNKMLILLGSITVLSSSSSFLLLFLNLREMTEYKIAPVPLMLMVYAFMGTSYITFDVWYVSKVLANLSKGTKTE